MRNYAAIDFETANYDAWSVVSVGVAKRVDGEIVSKEWLIQPPLGTVFETQYHVAIHGITEEMVANAPFFPEVWAEVMEFLGEDVTLVAHNACSAEKRFLDGVFDHYGMGEFEIPLICSMEYAKARIPRYCGQKYSLDYLAQQFGLTLHNHHDAKADAEMALLLFECLCNDELVGNLIQQLEAQEDERLDEQERQDEYFQAFCENLNPHGQLEGKTFLFTLDLDIGGGVLMKKTVACQLVQYFGGTCKSAYSRRVDFVVAGVDDGKYGDMWQYYQDWLHASSEEEKDVLWKKLTGKIKAAIRGGGTIINSQMFLDMLQ